MDELTQVDDRYRHVAGDAVVSHIAARLCEGGSDDEVAARTAG